jgi:hypothetical protein
LASSVVSPLKVNIALLMGTSTFLLHSTVYYSYLPSLLTKDVLYNENVFRFSMNTLYESQPKDRLPDIFLCSRTLHSINFDRKMFCLATNFCFHEKYQFAVGEACRRITNRNTLQTKLLTFMREIFYASGFQTGFRESVSGVPQNIDENLVILYVRCSYIY